MVLIATLRSITVSNPSYTMPIAPLPSVRVMAYLPMVLGISAIATRSRLALDQLERLLQAAAHAVEGRAERGDLVAALAELGHVEVALRDLVRRGRHLRDRADDHHR